MRKIIILLALVFIGIECNAQWTLIQKNSTFPKIYANNNFVFMSIEKPNDGSQYGMYDIFVSENNGDSFTLTISPNYSQYDIFFVGDDIYAKAAVSGYYKYMNGGMNWEFLKDVSYMTPAGKILNIPDEITDYEFPEIIEINGKIYIATFNNGVFYSDDNGKTFRSSNLNEFIFKFFTNGNNIYACSSNGLYISKNNGETWNKKNLGLTCNEPCNYGDIISFNGNIIVSFGDEVYLSKDDCNNWIDFSEGLSNLSEVNTGGFFAVNNKYIFYAYEGGIYRRSLK
ncbi:MAG TPA: hypothetical protein VIK14_02845 [Ignavibacteria bacterium]